MPEPRSRGGAFAVAAGILLSRITGLVRQSAIAVYLGQTSAAGVFVTATRIPNLLQNLLGEGVLSASFIPVYARLRAEGKHDEAVRVARAVGTLLALIAATVALLGVVAARPIVDILAPGFGEHSRELTVTLVRILFPGIALLVMSAWCLGVLNSHRKFFLSYVAPVLSNIAMITAVIVAGRAMAGRLDDIATWLAYGAVIGAAAQFLVQMPTVIELLRDLRPSLAVRDPGVRATLRAFGPVLLGRGSSQLSGYVDLVLASYLGDTIVAAIQNAQVIALLPVSLFGMAIAAAELPEMAGATGGHDERAAVLQARLTSALRRVVFLVVPSAVAFVMIGDDLIALLFQHGKFDAEATRIAWIILAGSAVGLSAQTQARVLNSAFYALGDTRTPMITSIIRLAITGLAGYLLVLPLRDAYDYAPEWGAFGLTASAGFAAWVEFLLLRRWLDRRIGRVAIPNRLGAGALAASIVAGALGYGAALGMHAVWPRRWVEAIAAIGVFGIAYVAIMAAARVPELDSFLRRLRRR